MIAPVAQFARLGSEVSGRTCCEDRFPDGGEGSLESDELVVIRGVRENRAGGEIDQAQLCGNDSASAQQYERVELHLEERLGFGELARRFSGLVVDHPHLTRRCNVYPVDEAAESNAVLQFGLDVDLARLGIESSGIFERVVRRDELADFVEERIQLALRNKVSGLGRLGTDTFPRGTDEFGCAIGNPVTGRECKQCFQCRVYDGASDLGSGWRFRNSVDCSEAIEQGALFVVTRPRRRERRPTTRALV